MEKYYSKRPHCTFMVGETIHNSSWHEVDVTGLMGLSRKTWNYSTNNVYFWYTVKWKNITPCKKFQLINNTYPVPLFFLLPLYIVAFCHPLLFGSLPYPGSSWASSELTATYFYRFKTHQRGSQWLYDQSISGSSVHCPKHRHSRHF